MLDYVEQLNDFEMKKLQHLARICASTRSLQRIHTRHLHI